MKLNSLQAIENMERETRIELATNSLEDCTFIEKQRINAAKALKSDHYFLISYTVSSDFRAFTA